LGIQCYARKSKSSHYWTKKEIALLGKMTAGAAAAALDFALSAVRLKRISLGIPPFGRKGS
jgi:Cys-tRNA synthase (O-phospho-L-seryl-tRNA:Cys-tRNA synthase)